MKQTGIEKYESKRKLKQTVPQTKSEKWHPRLDKKQENVQKTWNNYFPLP